MLKPDGLQIDESIKDLQKSKLFRDLDVRDFSKFVKHINFRIYQAGETIFKSNTPANKVYYVYSGSINLEIENEVIDKPAELIAEATSARPVPSLAICTAIER